MQQDKSCHSMCATPVPRGVGSRSLRAHRDAAAHNATVRDLERMSQEREALLDFAQDARQTIRSLTDQLTAQAAQTRAVTAQLESEQTRNNTLQMQIRSLEAQVCGIEHPSCALHCASRWAVAGVGVHVGRHCTDPSPSARSRRDGSRAGMDPFLCVCVCVCECSCVCMPVSVAVFVGCVPHDGCLAERIAGYRCEAGETHPNPAARADASPRQRSPCSPDGAPHTPSTAACHWAQ